MNDTPRARQIARHLLSAEAECAENGHVFTDQPHCEICGVSREHSADPEPTTEKGEAWSWGADNPLCACGHRQTEHDLADRCHCGCRYFAPRSGF